MHTLETEVLVIGSGFGAAAPALRLSRAGARVLMIEKGKHIVPEKDFKQTQDPKYLLQFLKGMSGDTVGFTYAEALGGGSGFYEMVSLRAPSAVFEQTDEEGRRYWPAGIDRRTMDPYYDIAEEMLHVEQIAVEDVPKSGAAFAQLMKNLGYSCDRARYAVKGCIGSGYCISGCLFGAKQSLHYNYLPASRDAGIAILTETEAVDIRSIEHDLHATRRAHSLDALPYRYEVFCRSVEDERIAVRAKIVILGGGTVGTAKLLLRSRENMPFLSDHVGRNIAVNGSVKAVGLLPEGFIEGDMLSGRSHPGMISYEFFPSRGITVSSAKPLPLHVVSAAHLYAEGDTRDPVAWGEANVELMKQYRRRMIVLYALGLTPPQAEIVATGHDTFEPKLVLTDDVRSYYRETKELLNSIFHRNGCTVVKAKMIDGEGKEYEDLFFGTTHMIGSCRMAERKEDGVIDPFGEVFDYPGLYVTDGAAVPTSLAVNSSLTILANAERIAAHLAKKFGRVKREMVVGGRG